jgi:nicotinamidase-related amidase
MRTALLVMDMQNGIVERIDENGSALARVGATVTAARTARVPVIFVRVAFRPDYVEVSPRNKGFSALAEHAGDAFTVHSPATQVHASPGPEPGEPVVVKKRISVFAGSDLGVLLRSLEITHLVLAGIATSGVVPSTIREAADRDDALIVLRDCCADADPEVHRVLVEKVFPRQADVLTAAEWVQTLPPPSSPAARTSAQDSGS